MGALEASMLWLLALSALAADPVDQIAGLFPGSAVTTVQGDRSIAPIRRQGKAGWIPADEVSAVEVDGGRRLVAFRLEMADVAPDALEQAAAEPGVRTRVLQVVLLDADGSFVAEPEGFPLEAEVDLRCLGDFCNFGPSGRLEPVEGSTTWAVLRWSSGEMESMGALKPLRVQGDTIRTYDDVAEGSGGGLTGCGWTQEHQSLRERDGALKAMRMQVCGDGTEACEPVCSDQGYPQERTLQPVTLAP